MISPWPTTTLGDLFDIAAGKAVTPAARHGTPRYPFLRTANVFWGRIDLGEVDEMYFAEADFEAKTLRRGDLLVCEGGDIGRSAIWNGEIARCSFQNHLHRLRPKTKNAVPAFFMYALQAGFTLLGRYEGAGNKTTIPNLSRNRLAALQVPVPPRAEQERIVAVLARLQHAISIETRFSVTNHELRHAAMTELFGRGLRKGPVRETEVGAIPASWDVKPLAELREFLQYGTSVKCDYRIDGNPVLRIPNIIDGRVDASDLKFCKLDTSVVSSLVLGTGDVLFVRTNGVRERVGRCAVYTGIPEKALFASYLIRARLKRDLLDPFFLQYYTTTPVGAGFLSGRSSPAADGKFNINTKTIDSVLVPLPKVDEQEEIVAVLRKIDASMDSHERRRVVLQELFKGMLERLVTGELRVDKLKIDTSDLVAA